MIDVKLSTNFAYSPFARQTPRSAGQWGNYQFHINDGTKECDWWVVYEGLDSSETVNCPKDRTILITDEPPTVRKYSQQFLDQFHTVISCHKGLKHPNVINTQKSHPWMVGCRFVLGSKATLEENYDKSYDELKAMRLPLPKSKTISIVSSNKKSTAGHANRLKFTEELKEYFKDKLDVYGRGIKDFADKWDVIAPYKYHIALENSSCPDYYTEKLIDAFMGASYPVYYGCPNISNYFPDGSLQPININDVKGSISLIEKCLEENRYEKNFDLIKQSRNLLLDRYNIFPFLCDEIFVKTGTDFSAKGEVVLNPEIRTKPGVVQRALNYIYKATGLKDRVR